MYPSRKTYYVYILASQKNGTLYIGVTNDMAFRLEEHKKKVHPKSFTAQYNVSRLVYFEIFSRIEDAIAREKRLKKWNRAWKIALVEKHNPDWKEIEIDVWD